VGMRVLLDTHAFLWWVTDDERLTSVARATIGASDNQIHVSAASVWEIVTKSQLGRLSIPRPIGAFVADQLEGNAFQTLSITVRHAFGLESLPELHRDPFDRILVAQALVEEMPLVTGDRAIQAYPATTIW
jgi:PIN domain nuclease of toxin-antitoxin system